MARKTSSKLFNLSSSIILSFCSITFAKEPVDTFAQSARVEAYPKTLYPKLMVQVFKDEVYGAGFTADIDASKGVKRKVAGVSQQDKDAAAAEVSSFLETFIFWSKTASQCAREDFEMPWTIPMGLFTDRFHEFGVERGVES